MTREWIKVPFDTEGDMILSVNRERIEDLLCCAFEGGSDYWACTGVTLKQMEAVGADYPFEVATRGGEVEVFDAEEPDTKLGVLNLPNIRAGMLLMREKYSKHYADFVKQNEDAGTADVFLQLAVLGEITYG